MEAVLKARVELAELNGYAHAIPNPLLLMSPWVIREAMASSEVENINTTIIQALQNQLLPEDRRSLPDKEVLRYRDALIWGFENMSGLPLSGRLIQGMHGQLFPDSSGFRRSQNMIQNSLTREIIYTPPPPLALPDLISNLEVFIHQQKTNLDPLLKTVLTHYQFEAIHPFDYGNGRVGRMLMVLQLVHENVLKYPILYISGYINRNKLHYYRSLRKVTEAGEWGDFVLFLLEGFHLQAKATKETLFAVMNYRETFREKFKATLPGIYDSDLVDLLFSQPIVMVGKFAEKMNLHRTTASRYLQQMASAGLLLPKQEGRNQFYINHSLLGILSEM
ncbi:MAG: Fic family protein [Saprospiraceae bacterium]